MAAHSDKIYTASTACAVGALLPATLRAWRNNNGFLKEAATGGWNRFSLVDLCLVRFVAQMTQSGFSAETAVAHSIWLAPNFAQILAGKATSEYAWLTDREVIFASAETPITHFLANRQAVSETSAFVDLKAIVEHVLKQIRALQPETIATDREAQAMAANALAKAISPKPDKENS